MDKSDIGKHISRQYDSELEDIRNQVLIMGGLVEKQLADAIKAMAEKDAELADLVTSRDYEINRMEVAIDEECTQIIARRQPAASDLRLVIAVIKTITDLERIGDEAERIGRKVKQIIKESNATRYSVSLESMGEQVRNMLNGALNAFARMDVETAINTWQKDRKVDSQYESIMRELITYMMEDPRSIPWVMELIWSARSLERIGDRSSNICEYVIYLVKGKDVRHTSLEQMEKEID